MPRSASRRITSGAGCPYEFRPTLTTAMRGRVASRSGSPVLPADPWCPTLSTWTGPSVCTIASSTGNPLSPVNNARKHPYSTRSTTEFSFGRNSRSIQAAAGCRNINRTPSMTRESPARAARHDDPAASTAAKCSRYRGVASGCPGSSTRRGASAAVTAGGGASFVVPARFLLGRVLSRFLIFV